MVFIFFGFPHYPVGPTSVDFNLIVVPNPKIGTIRERHVNKTVPWTNIPFDCSWSRIGFQLDSKTAEKCNLNYMSNKLTSFHCDIYWSWGPCSLKKMGKLVEKLNTKKEVTDARESKESNQSNDFFLKYVYIPGIQNREIKKVKCKMRLARDLLHEIIKRKAEYEKILTPSLSKRTMIFSSFLTCES